MSALSACNLIWMLTIGWGVASLAENSTGIEQSIEEVSFYEYLSARARAPLARLSSLKEDGQRGRDE